MARLPGIVQGVVVQIRIEARRSAATEAAGCGSGSTGGCAMPCVTAAPPAIGNAAQMVSLWWSRYSTSASASAVLLDDRPHHRLRAAIELSGLARISSSRGRSAPRTGKAMVE
jgi:hypothetical protein